MRFLDRLPLPDLRWTLYTAATLIPALALMLVGLHALWRQREVTRALIRSNRALAGERFAAEVESIIQNSVSECLSLVVDRPFESTACAEWGELFEVHDGRVLLGRATQANQIIAAWLRFLPRLRNHLTYPLAITDPPLQAFFMAIPAQQHKLLVLQFDLDSARRNMPMFRKLSGVECSLEPRRAQSGPGTFFRTLFPFWSIAVNAASGTSFPEAEITGSGVVLVLVGLLLAFAAVFAAREALRESSWNALRSRLVSGVSHDLRTPVASIGLYAELLQSHYDSPDVRGCALKQLRHETERLLHRIERLLRFARTGALLAQYAAREEDLRTVVERALASFRKHAEDRGFVLEAQLEYMPGPLPMDADAVSDAVWNLLDNAMKFSGQSRRIELRLYPRDAAAVVAVRDFGSGIPAGEHKKIFRAFYRVPGEQGQGGFGLGLFLVAHVMQEHGGRVEVESVPGQGSEFRLIFQYA